MKVTRHIFSHPEWVTQNIHPFSQFSEIPSSVFSTINTKLDRLQNSTPIVSIVIIAWNEEVNILNCISSLANLRTDIPFEIVVINNDSSDETQRTLDNLHVRSYIQKVKGCGPSRQLGQEKAWGKYIFLADADCIYPDCWLNKMLVKIQKPNVVCVYGRYSFISSEGFPRWKLFLFETLKDIIAEIRHLKRPYLNSFGMSMGYIKDLGLKVGFVGYQIRGEDGRLCFDLMKYGKVVQVKDSVSRVWTYPRTLQTEGTFEEVLYGRIKLELQRFRSLFRSHPPHDTKISKNA